MDGAQNIHYGRLPKGLINTYSDVLFWQWFHDETKGARLHKGSLGEIKKYWHDNIFITATPEVDNASDLTMEIIGSLLGMFGSKPIKKSFDDKMAEYCLRGDPTKVGDGLMDKSMTWSGHMIRKRLKFQGMDISIETPAGYLRSGKDPDGKKWRAMLHFDYGYIRGTKGVDGDHVDCFIGVYYKSDKVFVIHQKDVKTGKYDEDKVMLGWKTKTQAVKDYLLNYNRKDMFMGVTEMPINEFKKKAYATAKNPKMIKAYNLDAVAKKNKLDISKFNRKELIAGIAVEREHMADPKTKVAHSISDLLKIAVAHLKEDSKYYTKLAKIEKPSKKSIIVKSRIKI